MNEFSEYTENAEYDSSESYPEYSEAYPEYSEANWGEAKRRPSTPVRTAPRQSAYTPRPTGTSNPVTQAQLQAALARVSSQIGVNSNAIKTVDNRLRGATTELGRQGGALRKEVADRKKVTDGIRREMQSTRELGALVGILAAQGGTLGTVAPLALLLPPEILGLSAASSDSGGTSNSLLGGGGLVPIIAIAAAAGLIHP
jgi:hypothetical protein